MSQKFDEILSDLAKEVTGYKSSALVDIEGMNIATNALGKTNLDLISAQITMLLRQVDNVSEKMQAGKMEDNLLGTASTYIMMRYLPGNQYFLCIEVDRKTSNLGNMRLMSKLFTERLSQAMPH